MFAFAVEIFFPLSLATYDMKESTALHACETFPATSCFRLVTSRRFFWLKWVSSDTLCAMPRGGAFVLTLLLPTAISGQALVNMPATQGPAAGFVLESWTVKDGLPVNSINKVIQSRSGYIWLATFDGLVRFDGARFTTFNIGNSDGLPTSRIIDVVEESDGSLLLTTESRQLVRFTGGKFTPLNVVSSPSGVRPETMTVG